MFNIDPRKSGWASAGSGGPLSGSESGDDAGQHAGLDARPAGRGI